jgi:HlyD family secretion protein
MPYLKTDVSVRSSALIRPASEVNVIRCISSGKIRETYAGENKKVKAGELLYVIDSETLNEQEDFFQEKISIKKSLAEDVELVIEASKTPLATKPIFNNAIYRQSFFTYLQKLSEAQNVYNKAKQAHDRQLKLYQEKVIAAMEFENFQFELKKAEDARAQLKETQRSQWQSELKTLHEEKNEMESQLVRILIIPGSLTH